MSKIRFQVKERRRQAAQAWLGLTIERCRSRRLKELLAASKLPAGLTAKVEPFDRTAFTKELADSGEMSAVTMDQTRLGKLLKYPVTMSVIMTNKPVTELKSQEELKGFLPPPILRWPPGTGFKTPMP